ncbi:TLC ATP/ADP transporter [Prunus dulcis]|uniref:TLC ATP/ADP transporter n=1 Tax=Prunus dulcis TaxID=3755 RepID=A0A4Y1RCV1_PRUDU|nr:TLC ATP/ADP transporter [Prunus dulcis]
MARGPSCSRSRSGSEERVRGKDSDTSVTYRLVREYCGIEVDVDKLENAFTGTSPVFKAKSNRVNLSLCNYSTMEESGTPQILYLYISVLLLCGRYYGVDAIVNSEERREGFSSRTFLQGDPFLGIFRTLDLSSPLLVSSMQRRICKAYKNTAAQ